MKLGCEQLRLLAAWVLREIAGLDPACFGLVMATGITSNASWLIGRQGISDALVVVNLFAYVWLVIATLVRAWRFPAALGNDLVSPQMVFSFFTSIAASNILGLQLELRGYAAAASVLWLMALSIWLALTYFSFGLVMLSNSAAAPDLVVRGGWLLAIVATQSLVILGARLAGATLDPGRALVFFLIHALWGIAVVLYGLFITLFAHRVLYFRVDPEDLTAPLWVIMGAAAISANAGVALIEAAEQPGFLQAMSPFIGAATLIAWAWGTWWIPLLAMFGLWKHGIRRVRLTYTAALWSIVFPLGMYAVATDRLSVTAQLVPLRALAHGMAWIAVAAWLMTALGLMLGAAASLQQFARSWRRAGRG